MFSKSVWFGFFFCASAAWSAPDMMSEAARCHGRSKANDSSPWAMSILVPNVHAIKPGTKVTWDGYLLVYRNSATLMDPEPKTIAGPFSAVPVKWEISMIENESFGKTGGTIEETPPPHFIAAGNFVDLNGKKESVKIDSQGRGERQKIVYDCDYDLFSNQRSK